MGVTTRGIVNFLEAPNPRGLSGSQMFLENEDLKPVEAGRRTWRKRNFITFWIADGFNLNTWFIVSASVVAGLSWWQAWITVWIGYTITGFFVAAGARPGAIYHIPFPVFCRSSFGILGSLWPVLNRACMACVWTGVQSWIGGQCVTLLLRSLAPSYNNLPNGMSASSGTNTRDFVSFFIFILLHLPVVWFPVHKVKLLFTIKSIVAPIAGISYFIWMLVRAKGIGPIVKQPATISGGELGWAMLDGIMSSIANFATLMCNASDFSRFADTPSAAKWPQIIAIPMTFGLVSFVGVMVASASVVIYGGAPIWNPLGMLSRMLDDTPYDSATRAGVFFISAAFILAQLGTNIAANTISAGTDLTALAPRFLTIRRGGYVAVLVAFIMCPWNLLSSSNNFTTYLSAYSVFLSAIIGVMFTDYYVIRRGKMDIAELYSFKKTGYAWYNWGINWRAYVAYICGIIPNAPGFGGAVGATTVPIGATRVYQLNFFVGFITSSLIYFVLSRYVSKVPRMEVAGWHEAKNWEPEEMYNEGSVPTFVYAESDSKVAKADEEDAKY